MDGELADIVHRLQSEWPAVDVVPVVTTAYRSLAEGARITMYLPLLAERLARRWLTEGRHTAA